MVKISRCVRTFYVLFLVGCAGNEPEKYIITQEKQSPSSEHKKKKIVKEKDIIWDPLEPWNRGVFVFNQAIEHLMWEPLLAVYKTVIPSCGQKGVHNLLEHLKTPMSLISLTFQGEGEKTLIQFARCICNTLFGLGGIIDIAKDLNIETEPEDLSSLLKTYNVPTGCFMILPFLGPTVSRDAFGKLCSSAAYTWISPFAIASYGLFGAENLNQRLIFKDSIDHVMEFSADPYVVIRRAYYESRGEFPNSFEELSEEEEQDEDEE